MPPGLNRRLSLIVDMSSKAALAGLKQLQGAVNAVSASAARVGAGAMQGFAELQKGATAATGAMQRLGTWIRSGWMIASIAISAATVAIGIFINKTAAAYQQMQSAIIGLRTIAESYGYAGDEAEAAARQLEKSTTGFLDMGSAAQALKNLMGAGLDLPRATEQIRAMTEQAIFNRQTHYSVAQAVMVATEGIRNNMSIAADATGTTKNLALMTKEYARALGLNWMELTKEQVAEAAYIGFMEQATRSAGDFAKALGTAQGQQIVFGFGITKALQAIGEFTAQIKWGVANAFVPYLKQLREWIAAHKEMLQQKTTEWVKTLTAAVTQAVEAGIKYSTMIAGWIIKNKDFVIEVGKAAIAVGVLAVAISYLKNPMWTAVAALAMIAAQSSVFRSILKDLARFINEHRTLLLIIFGAMVVSQVSVGITSMIGLIGKLQFVLLGLATSPAVPAFITTVISGLLGITAAAGPWLLLFGALAAAAVFIGVKWGEAKDRIEKANAALSATKTRVDELNSSLGNTRNNTEDTGTMMQWLEGILITLKKLIDVNQDSLLKLFGAMVMGRVQAGIRQVAGILGIFSLAWGKVRASAQQTYEVISNTLPFLRAKNALEDLSNWLAGYKDLLLVLFGATVMGKLRTAADQVIAIINAVRGAFGLLVQSPDARDWATGAKSYFEQDAVALQAIIDALGKLSKEQVITFRTLGGKEVTTTAEARLKELQGVMAGAKEAYAIPEGKRTSEQRETLGMFTSKGMGFTAIEKLPSKPTPTKPGMTEEQGQAMQKLRELQAEINMEAMTGYAKEVESINQKRDARIAELADLQKQAGVKATLSENTLLADKEAAMARAELNKKRQEDDQKTLDKTKSAIFELGLLGMTETKAELARIEAVRVARHREIDEMVKEMAEATAQLPMYGPLSAAEEGLRGQQAQLQEQAPALKQGIDKAAATETTKVLKDETDKQKQIAANQVQTDLQNFRDRGLGHAAMLDGMMASYEIAMNVMGVMGKAFVTGQKGQWRSLAAASLESIAMIMRALARQYAAMSVGALIGSATDPRNFAKAAQYGAQAMAASVGAGVLEGMASKQQDIAERINTRENAQAQQELNAATGGGGGAVSVGTSSAPASFASVSVQKEPNITISPSVTIEAGHDVFIGEGSVEEFKVSLERVMVQSIKDAMSTGQIKIGRG